MKSVYYLLVEIVLAGCAANPSYHIYRDGFKATDEKGAIAGTITIMMQKPMYNAYAMLYRDQKKPKIIYEVLIKPSILGVFKADTIVDGGMVFHYVYKHTPGEYEFLDYTLFRNGPLVETTIRSKSKFSVPFTVKKGKISYLGDIVSYSANNSDGYFIEWKNNYERELPEFKKLYPRYDWSLAEDNTPKDGYILAEKLIQFK